MERKIHIHLIDIRGFLITLLFGVFSQVTADETLRTTIDCSEVKINFEDNPEWTHSERLKAMDRAFFVSVNHFELCSLSNKPSSSATVKNGINQSSNAASEIGIDSMASQEMTGTETGSPPPGKSSSENSNTAENTDKQSSKIKIGGGTNSARPKDIPAADNDDVIAAQIRLAAEIEQDPVKKKKLWNEYRKYKGMQTQ
jgi:hypothetical protein